MKIEQIYTGCLAQGAYYIESNGEVAIIDPLRETQQYVDKATKENAKIKYKIVFQTCNLYSLYKRYIKKAYKGIQVNFPDIMTIG